MLPKASGVADTNSIEPKPAPKSVKNLPISRGSFDALHLNESLKEGSVQIDFDQALVSLSINGQAPLLFEIQDISSGSCGKTIIKATVTINEASEEVMDEIIITDNSSMICRIFLPYEASLKWTTYSGVSMAKIVAESQIILGERGRPSADLTKAQPFIRQ